MIGFGIFNKVVIMMLFKCYWLKCKMDFYYCIVLMYCFILGKICDYFFYNLSFSFILLKNVDGFLMKNIFFNIGFNFDCLCL